MASYALHVIQGNIGRTPELKYSGAGKAICEFSVAVSRRKKINDAWAEETTWYTVVTWEQAAERAATYAKGQTVLVQGDHLVAEPYITKQGEARVSLKLTANKVVLQGKPEGASAPAGNTTTNDSSTEDLGDDSLDVDDIPF